MMSQENHEHARRLVDWLNYVADTWTGVGMPISYAAFQSDLRSNGRQHRGRRTPRTGGRRWGRRGRT